MKIWGLFFWLYSCYFTLAWGDDYFSIGKIDFEKEHPRKGSDLRKKVPLPDAGGKPVMENGLVKME